MTLTNKDGLLTLYDNGMKMPFGLETPDPFLYRFNGKYYLYFTTPDSRISCYVSDDMLHFEPCNNKVTDVGYCYDYRLDPNHPKTGDCPYAPEVIYHDGYFYMVASPSGNGHYFFRAEKPEGPFICITENLERRIDGSFFIDSDGKKYLFTSGEESIRVYEINDDFTSCKGGKGTEGGKTSLLTCRLSGWNEGPYMLKRYGRYYLTYCGAHFLSRDYRVDYATERCDTFDPTYLERKATILVSTNDDYYGLGHSCTVLGPDLDSYFMVYHNMEKGLRYYNLARISFDDDRMALNGMRRHGIPFVRGAHTTYGLEQMTDKDDMYIIAEHGDTYSAEFNNIGYGEMILSRNHEKTLVLNFKGNSISLVMQCGKNYQTIQEYPLDHLYRKDVIHSFLFQFRQGRFALYFDHRELGLGQVELGEGAVGYRKNHTFHEILSSSISAVALGSSDNLYPADTIHYAKDYEEGSYLCEKTKTGFLRVNQMDDAIYSIFVPDDQEEDIILTIPASSFHYEAGMTIDKNEFYQFTLPSFKTDKEVRTRVLTLPMKKGVHAIHFSGDFSFSAFEHRKHQSGTYISMRLDQHTDLDEFHCRNVESLEDMGLVSYEDKVVSLLTKQVYTNAKVETDMVFVHAKETGGAGLLLSVTDYCIPFKEDADGNEHAYSFRGFFIGFGMGRIYIKKVDYNFLETIASKEYPIVPGKSYHLAAYQKNNELRFCVNGAEVIKAVFQNGNLNGKVGLYAKNCNACFTSLAVHAQH